MNTPSRGSAEPPQVNDYFIDSVERLLKDNAAYEARALRWGDKIVESLVHFVDRRDPEPGLVGYHIAYRAVDFVERKKQWGIAITRPRKLLSNGSDYARQRVRHHLTQEGQPGVLRQDVATQSVEPSIQTTLYITGEVGNNNDKNGPHHQLHIDLRRLDTAHPILPLTIIEPAYFNKIGLMN